METKAIPAWAERMDEALAARGWSVPELARKMGRGDDPQFIESLHKYRNGRVENPRGSTVADIAKALDMTEAELRHGLGAPHALSPTANSGTRPRRLDSTDGVREVLNSRVTIVDDAAILPRNVPVMGITSGGPGTDFYMNGEVIDRVKRPPAIADVKDAYALYVVGDSMHPRFGEGELIYIHPGQKPRVGDDVVIQLYPKDEGDSVGASFVKRLVRRSGSKITVEQFNPASQLEFDVEEVKAIHRIVPFTELLG